MDRFDLFHLYRFMLSLVVAVYCGLRALQSLWHWVGLGRDGSPQMAILRRYVILLLLRLKLRHFLSEFSVIVGLSAVLILLLSLHVS